MHRIVKLLGIIFILGIVSFIICDEKGIKISLQDNRIIFNKVEKSDEVLTGSDYDEIEKLEPVVVYKNSNIIHIYNGFNNPYELSKGAGVNSEFISMFTKGNNGGGTKIIEIDDKSKISDSLLNTDTEKIVYVEKYKSIQHQLNINKSNPTYFVGSTSAIIGSDNQLDSNLEISHGYVGNEISTGDIIESGNVVSESINNEVSNLDVAGTGSVEPVDEVNRAGNGENNVSGNEDGSGDINNVAGNGEITQGVIGNEILDNPVITTVSVDRYIGHSHPLKTSSLIKKVEETLDILISLDRYESTSHVINLFKGKILEHEFVVEDNANVIDDSSDIFEDLLTKDEIDIQTLESENEEFLQKVFEETRDVKVMNLIVETYLNEYQFVKAKRFIENLPAVYSDELNPSLYLRVAFNSFSLSSKTFNSSLNSLVDKYANDQSISNEEKIWYKGVLALMQQNYDSFSEISKGFTSENHKAFALKIQGYRDQTSKQMGMPGYYFDTLVALELFNQGLFQPAKVLALSSLQQNPKYILPYQVLAYANFLTNSWETSIEYLKKLTDLDPNNAEKYRFLMGIAYYRNEKYEQSVLMLSMIKDEKLRLDSERYLIRDYLLLDQKNKLISSRGKLLGYDNLVTSDFYTYFYEVFYRPYSEGAQYEIYAYDTELAEKMLRVCNLRLSGEDKVICNYGNIGKSIALGQFDGLESSLLSLAVSYPQSYLYHALGEYYINQGDFVKAKAYLIKAVSMAQKRGEVSQIKKLLQSTLQN